jgi:YbgC/YbaW family acyl-CoA thioester hydrolase
MSSSRQRSDFRYLDRLRVRWAEVDMQKIVFNAHYLMYFDTAVAGYWRAMAMPYHEAMELLQGDLYARKATVEYEASARYDDVCDVGIRCARIGNSSMLFETALFRGHERLVHGELVYVFADPATQTSRPVPAALRALLLGFEQGDPALELRCGSWGEWGRAAAALREEVFVHEHRLPPSLSGDADDEQAVHVLAVNRLGMTVGTGRLLAAAAGGARIGRIAVHPGLRRSGVGQAVLKRLVGEARDRGAARVELFATPGTEPFYERAGFAPCAEPVQLDGRPLLPMRLSL